MLAGTKDGKSWGFYFDDQKNTLKKYFEITEDDHTALIEGQAKGKVVRFHEDRKPTLEEPPEPTEAEKAAHRISALKRFLAETDYVAIKIAEGAADKSEYKDTLDKRNAARQEINELKSVIV